ncbi:MAG: divalent cation tolerance protein CutA [Nitrososphaeria archaeon]|nr:divalent cation tolerance protein CutA [Nitrososphaeria archaeon]
MSTAVQVADQLIYTQAFAVRRYQILRFPEVTGQAGDKCNFGGPRDPLGEGGSLCVCIGDVCYSSKTRKAYLPATLALDGKSDEILTGIYVIIFVTVTNEEEARKIVNCLLEKRLIACGNIVGPVSSLFWWSQKIQESEECLLLVKSRLDLFGEISATIKDLHSYDVPEILALPIVKGSSEYLEWLDDSLTRRSRRTPSG